MKQIVSPFRIMLCLAGMTMGLAAIPLGPHLRENDQADLLAGAIELRNDGSFLSRNLYLYDKAYLGYWLAAGTARIMLSPGANDSENVARWLTLTNVLAWAAFAVGLGLCALGRKRELTFSHATLFLLVFPAPLFLFHAAYYANAILSFSVLAALGGFWPLRTNTRSSAWIAGLGAAVAVAFRADAVLVLPAFVWLANADGSARGYVGPRQLALFVGAGLALGTGWLVAGHGRSGHVAPLYFDPRVLTAYLAVVMPGLVPAGVWVAWRLARSTPQRWHRRLGLAALALPWLFYLPQHHTPRYFFLAALATWLIGRRVLPKREAHTDRRQLRFALATGFALVLLSVAGLDIRGLARFRPAWLDATRMPTADGVTPVGAWAPFLSALRQSHRTPVDHNQAVWETASAMRFSAENGTVFLLRSPLHAYLRLAALTQGYRVVVLCGRETDLALGETVYVEERAVRRDACLLERICRYPVTVAAPVANDSAQWEALLEIRPRQASESARTFPLSAALAPILKGADYRYAGGETINATLIRQIVRSGRTALYVAPHSLGKPDRPVDMCGRTVHCGVVRNKGEIPPGAFHEDILWAWTVFPEIFSGPR